MTVFYQTGFHLTNDASSKVMQELLIQGSSMAEWRQLLKLGVKYGKNGKPTVDLLECLCTWMHTTSKSSPEYPQCLGPTSEKGSEENSSAMEWFERALGVSTQQSLWKQENSHSTTNGVHYIKPLQHMMVGFGNFDPTMEKKLACCPDLPAFACK